MSSPYTFLVRTTNNVLDIKSVSLQSLGLWTAPITSLPGVTGISVSMSSGTYPTFGSSNTNGVTGTATTNGITYNVYTFTTISTTATYTVTYTCANPTYCYVLAVGGGGGGGGFAGGGGGAGGVVMNPVYLPAGTNQTITISVGDGGTGSVTDTNGNSGNISSLSFSSNQISSIYAYGGGGGGSKQGTSSGSGSSSGGGSYWGTSVGSNSNNYNNYGNIGGIVLGGGGGAGICGTTGVKSSTAGNGGNGIQCFLPGIRDFIPSGTKYGSYYWGGGGGGATDGPGSITGSGGFGGGGGGGYTNTTTAGFASGGSGGINLGNPGAGSNGAGGAGGVNTGGGGGGGGNTPLSYGGKGGSGIVIIAFPSNQVTSNIASVLTSTQLSSTATNSIRGAYGNKLLNYNYYGPTFTLRHSADTTGAFTQNFYADVCGNLTTGYNSGMSVYTWLASQGANPNYAYVTKWYNQGMDISFNSMTQTTLNSQPIYDVSNQIINFGYTSWYSSTNYYPSSVWTTANTGNAYLNIPNTAVPYNDMSYCISLRHGKLPSQTQGIFYCGPTWGMDRQHNNLVLSTYQYNNSWFGVDNKSTTYTGTLIAQDNTVTFDYAGNGGTQNIYVNGTNSSKSAGSVRLQVTGPNTLGYANQGFTGSQPYMNSYLHYFYMFNYVLSSTERNLIESTPAYFNTTYPQPNTILPIVPVPNQTFTGKTLLVSNITGYYSYTNGMYDASASNTSSTQYPYLAFNGTTSTYWKSTGTYTSGIYGGTLTTTVSGTSRSGEWLQIQLPYSVYLSSYSIMSYIASAATDTNYPQIWYVAGSTNGTTWSLVDSQSLTTNPTTGQTIVTGFNYNVVSPSPYSYYRLIVNRLFGGTSLQLSQFNLSGYQTSYTQIQSLTLTQLTTTSFSISWIGGVGALSYTYYLNGTATVPTTDNGVTNQTATFTGLTAGNRYSVYIRANYSGRSVYSITLPTLINGCFCWLDAADTSTITKDANNYVTNWQDKSVNAYQVVQNGNNTLPVSQNLTTTNTIQSIYYGGANSHKSTTMVFPDNPYTIFVIGSNSNNGYSYFISGSSDKYLGVANYSGTTNFTYYCGNGTSWSNLSAMSTNVSVASLSLMTVSYDNPTANTSNGYVNGTSVGTKTGTSATFTGVGFGAAISGASPGQFMKGNIGEVIMYNNKLSTSSQQYIEGYLAWKWGTQTSLPAGHPYSSSSLGCPSGLVVWNP